MKKRNEQEIIAEELAKMMARLEKKHGLEVNYTAYVIFCTIGSIEKRHSPDRFEKYINEINDVNEVTRV